MIRGLFVYIILERTHCVSKVSMPVKLERLKTLPRLTEKSSAKGSLDFVAFAPRTTRKSPLPFWWKMEVWTTIAGPIASLMIENILEKNHSNRFRNESFKYQFKRSIRNTRRHEGRSCDRKHPKDSTVKRKRKQQRNRLH
jgi:hypothetical protein